jgi:hypothetical protein
MDDRSLAEITVSIECMNSDHNNKIKSLLAFLDYFFTNLSAVELSL